MPYLHGTKRLPDGTPRTSQNRHHALRRPSTAAPAAPPAAGCGRGRPAPAPPENRRRPRRRPCHSRDRLAPLTSPEPAAAATREAPLGGSAAAQRLGPRRLAHPSRLRRLRNRRLSPPRRLHKPPLPRPPPRARRSRAACASSRARRTRAESSARCHHAHAGPRPAQTAGGGAASVASAPAGTAAPAAAAPAPSCGSADSRSGCDLKRQPRLRPLPLPLRRRPRRPRRRLSPRARPPPRPLRRPSPRPRPPPRRRRAARTRPSPRPRSLRRPLRRNRGSPRACECAGQCVRNRAAVARTGRTRASRSRATWRPVCSVVGMQALWTRWPAPTGGPIPATARPAGRFMVGWRTGPAETRRARERDRVGWRCAMRTARRGLRNTARVRSDGATAGRKRPRRVVPRPATPRRPVRSSGAWTRERVVAALCAWAGEVGGPPRSYDWSPARRAPAGFRATVSRSGSVSSRAGRTTRSYESGSGPGAR